MVYLEDHFITISEKRMNYKMKEATEKEQKFVDDIGVEISKIIRQHMEEWPLEPILQAFAFFLGHIAAASYEDSIQCISDLSRWMEKGCTSFTK